MHTEIADQSVSVESFADLLAARARLTPQQEGWRFVGSDGETEQVLSYAELDRRARAIAAVLTPSASGQRALLLYPAGPDFVSGLFACFQAGVVAVPAFPPEGARLKRTLPRLESIAADAQCDIVLTTRAIAAMAPQFGELAPQLARMRWIATDDVAGIPIRETERPRAAGPIALLQYTSGSTAAPKGVVVTHANLLHNSQQIARFFGHGPSSRGVIWLPPQHDMGLVGGILQPLQVGFPVTLMSPLTFLSRPIRWLEAVSRWRATTSGGPDFAYRMCALKIAPEDKRGLDLSAWDVAFSGAEPVRADTIDLFSRAFADCGFRRQAFYPCYGLAEATLIVTGGARRAGPVVQHASRQALHGGAFAAPQGSDDLVQLVACGAPAADQRVAIVDPATSRERAPGQVGEVWCRGPSMAGGYWQRAEESEATFAARLDSGEGPFMRTGDLGFVHQGELYVTGRLKELIVVRGRNHYPQDIEQTVLAAAPQELGLREGGAMAFSDGDAALALCLELRRVPPEIDRLAARLAARVTDVHGVEVRRISFVRSGALPRTSSGKPQRRAAWEQLQRGELPTSACWERAAPSTATAPSETPCASLPAPPVTSDSNESARAPQLSAARVEQWLAEQAARRLRLDARAIDIHAPFADCGLDSADAVALATALQEWSGVAVPPTALWDHPHIAALAAFVATASGRRASPATPSQAAHAASTAATTAATTAASAPIAVIGVACHLPGGADDPAQFWQLLMDGRDAIGPVPADRPGAAALAATGQHGGFLRDVDCFDAGLFGIAPVEAASVDPQQRLLLETAWEAIERAGLAPASLQGSATGVFVGISNNDYGRLALRGAAASSRHAGTGNAASLAANRLSYTFGLTGPSLAVDTACSSSLVAVHLACQSLRAGECDTALAGGVNLILSPELTQIFSRAQMLAADSRCKTFGAAADGYVRSEGCAVLLLKPLAAAQRDADPVLAVIRGSAVNQDGRSNGLTAPNGSAQQAVVRAALRQAGLAPAQVGYVEAHGTGTPLGDPIEVDALRAVFEPDRGDQPCWIGSVKSNIGHLEAAAGIAGLLKAVLAVAHGRIPPHLHAGQLNPRVQLGRALRIPSAPAAWPGTGPRIAGVSAFGFGGTNVHLVVAEAPAPNAIETRQADRPAHLLHLSARTDKALQALAQRWIDRLDGVRDDELGDLCWSSHRARQRFERGVTIEAASTADLAAGLAAFLSGRPSAQVTRSGDAAGPRGVGPRVGLLVGEQVMTPADARALAATLPTFRRALEAHASAHAHADAQADTPPPLHADEAPPQRAIAAALVHTLSACGIGWHQACALGPAAFVPDGVPCVASPAELGCDAVVALGVEPSRLTALARPGCTLHLAAAPGAAPWPSLLRCLAQLDARGVACDWLACDRDVERRRLGVPTYPFERERHWLPPDRSGPPAPAARQPACFQVRWIPKPLASGVIEAARTWLVVGDDGPCAALAGALRARSQRAIRVGRGAGFEHLAADSFLARPGSKDDLAAVIAAIDGGGDLALVHVCGPDAGEPPAARAERACASLLAAATAVLSKQPPGAAEIHVVTCGAQPIDAHEAVDVAAAALWGFGRTLALEHPGCRVQLLDADPAAGHSGLDAVVDDLLSRDGEDQILLRQGRRHVARLSALDSPVPPAAAAVVRGDAAYLVTGGLGALGLEVARWLARLGARHLVLCGRHAPSAEAAQALAGLRDAGVTVAVEPLDVADAGAVEALVARLAHAAVPLRGIVHAAGLLDDGAVLQQRPERFASVLAPKAAGAWNLHAATARVPLTFFVMFSSLASLVGSPGQSNYAAANAFMDALAHRRRAEGRAALSINWGPFASIGMAATRRALRAGPAGIGSLDAGVALDTLGALLAGAAAPQVAVLDVDWPRVAASGLQRPLLADLVGNRVGERVNDGVGDRSHAPVASAAAAPTPAPGAAEGAAAILAAAPSERVARLADRLALHVAAVMGHPSPAQLDRDAGFLDLGLDSLMALDLQQRLQQDLGLALEATLVFNHPTITRLAAHLVERLAPPDRDPPPPPTGAATATAGTDPHPDSIARLLAHIESLADDEVEALLALEND